MTWGYLPVSPASTHDVPTKLQPQMSLNIANCPQEQIPLQLRIPGTEQGFTPPILWLTSYPFYASVAHVFQFLWAHSSPNKVEKAMAGSLPRGNEQVVFSIHHSAVLAVASLFQPPYNPLSLGGNLASKLILILHAPPLLNQHHLCPSFRFCFPSE